MRILAILLSLVPALSFAQQQPVSFSVYSPTLKLESVAPDGLIAKFLGTVTVTGVVYFEFDQGDSGHMVGVNFAKFVPDTGSISLLPSIIAGYFPAPVKYVLLEPAEAALEGAYGPARAQRIAHGSVHTTRKRVRVLMHNYTASVECDAREYMSTDSVVTPLESVRITSLSAVLGGC